LDIAKPLVGEDRISLNNVNAGISDANS